MKQQQQHLTWACVPRHVHFFTISQRSKPSQAIYTYGLPIATAMPSLGQEVHRSHLVETQKKKGENKERSNYRRTIMIVILFLQNRREFVSRKRRNKTVIDELRQQTHELESQ